MLRPLKVAWTRALDLANGVFKALQAIGDDVVLAPADAQLRRAPIEASGKDQPALRQHADFEPSS